MSTPLSARTEEPFFSHPHTGEDLELALVAAVREHPRSMDQLHAAATNCVDSLRRDGMHCEAALLTMKAFVRDAARRHKHRGSPDLMHVERLMEQVVTWCIADYYDLKEADAE